MIDIKTFQKTLREDIHDAKIRWKNMEQTVNELKNPENETDISDDALIKTFDERRKLNLLRVIFLSHAHNRNRELTLKTLNKFKKEVNTQLDEKMFGDVKPIRAGNGKFEADEESLRKDAERLQHCFNHLQESFDNIDIYNRRIKNGYWKKHK